MLQAVSLSEAAEAITLPIRPALGTSFGRGCLWSCRWNQFLMLLFPFIVLSMTTGTRGRPVNVLTNHFRTNLSTRGVSIFQYDVAISEADGRAIDRLPSAKVGQARLKRCKVHMLFRQF